MVYHSDEIPPDIWFQFNWSAAYALCILKLRYNQNCPFLVQSHISDFQEPCIFKCYVHCFKRRQRKRGNVIKPFAREIGTSQKFVSLLQIKGK